jgi:hypothetical protein
VKLNFGLTRIISYFTPSTYPTLDINDADFGSGGILLLPPQPGSIPGLATALGKDGNLYLLNAAALGSYHSSGNAVLGTYSGGGCWCAESYFTGSDGVNRVVSSGSNTLQTWQVHMTPSPMLVPDSWTQNIQNGQDSGFFTWVSSNGTANGIIWAVGRPISNSNDLVYLNAFDANAGTPLVTNMQAGHWPNTQGNANLVPVVTGGKVYVGSYKQLAIFGIKTTAGPPAAIQQVAPPQEALPADMHRLTGTIVSVSLPTIVLQTHSGADVTVDATAAIQSDHIAIAGLALIAVGHFRSDGALVAESISRAKSDPASWLPDR